MVWLLITFAHATAAQLSCYVKPSAHAKYVPVSGIYRIQYQSIKHQDHRGWIRQYKLPAEIYTFLKMLLYPPISIKREACVALEATQNLSWLDIWTVGTYLCSPITPKASFTNID